MTARTRAENKANATSQIDTTGSGGTTGTEVRSLFHDLADSALMPEDVGDLATLDTVDTAQIADEAITEAKLDAVDTPSDGEVLSYVSASGRFAWVAQSGGGGTDDQTAAEVSFAPAGNVSSSNVQAAIQELDTEKAASSHTHPVTQLQTTGTPDGTKFLRDDGEWAAAGMLASVYDPQTIADDAFDRANHTGAQAISTITDLQTALDDKADEVHTHAAADITSGTLATARLGSGTADSTVFLRGDGSWAAPAGGGDVNKVGTPVANRMAYWTGDGTLGHEDGFTYDPTTDTLTVDTVVIGGVTFDGTNQLEDPDTDSLLMWDDLGATAAWLTMGAGIATFLDTPSSANLLAAVTDETGTGALVFATSPVLVTPNLGTPSAINLANATNLPSSALGSNHKTDAIEFMINGSGSAITTGLKGFLQVPFAGTITSARLLADQTGSIVVDIWKDTQANHPPTDADSITAAAPPTLSSAVQSTDSTLTGWTTSVAAGDVLAFNVDSAATVTIATVVLNITRT